MTDYGFDTASTVTNSLASAAVGHYGLGAWIRYFDPTPGASTISSSSGTAVGEVDAMKANGAHHLCPITEPYQTRLSTGGSTGHSYGVSDASTFITAMADVVEWTGISVPNSLICYLCLESGYGLAVDYWNGWATTINSAVFVGAEPLYAGLYLNPSTSSGACSTVASAGSGEECYAIWTSTPEPCSRCLTPFSQLSGWSGTPCSSLPSYMWQYAEAGSAGCYSPTCGYIELPANVDLDAISAEYGGLGQMFSF